MNRIRVLIMGAAGRDFHNFNTVFRGNEAYEVVAFTAHQIPNIAGRPYPAELAGSLYPDGIPIYDEDEDLIRLIREHRIDQVIFSYSDVSHEYVMHKASEVLAAGADYRLLGAWSTQIKSSKPVISVCAVRTGSGKSQTTRRVAEIMQGLGYRVVVIRHPMPYGDLAKQAVQRFASYNDLDKHDCTIEEREEYEPHIDRGTVVYAGVDYEAILRQAEQEADIILWDGGNNDISFYVSDLHIVVADPHRPGHELHYHPGETNLRMADVVVINKIDTADWENVLTVLHNVRKLRPEVTVVQAASPVLVENKEAILGKRVLIVEDGPTLTHGGMAYGAGYIAAKLYGAGEIIDPRPFAVGSITETYAKYYNGAEHVLVLPAMGYGDEQMRELEETINASHAELVIAATPINLNRVIKVKRPMERVFYDLQEIGEPTLADILTKKFSPKG